MNTPIDFYQNEIENHKRTLGQLKRKLLLSSILRLLVFLSIPLGIYLGYPNTQIILGVLFIGIAVFIILVNRHLRLSRKKDLTQRLLEINKLEIEALHHQFEGFADGKEFNDSTHIFSYDIDLFGKGSFFHRLNRTAIQAGKQYLANLLKENTIDQILLKQEAIKNLASMPKWRQFYGATAWLIKVKTKTEDIEHWILNHKPIINNFFKVFPKIFTVISIGMFFGLFFDFVSENVFVYWFLSGLALTGTQLKKINVLYNNAGKAKETFEQYHQLVDQIESASFQSTHLINLREQLFLKNKKVSVILKDFAKILSAFDQRNNMLLGVILNGLFLWDIWQSYRIEHWIKQYKEELPKWFEVIAIFDAYNSLGNYAFNHPEYTYPNLLKDQTTIIEAKNLGHPFLKREKRVDNDIKICKEEFFIITGANMAGKSTFLRTVALQIVMSNVGLPVCATSCNYSPIKLISSMRTSDSINDEASYFFSELAQLKKIIELLKQDVYFVILDEILKGTNSKDKAEGSKKFVRRLAQEKATGIIATHDLSLCDLSDQMSTVYNKYFDAQIIDDELYFDYKFKEGVCQNMNASFLLKKLGIV